MTFYSHYCGDVNQASSLQAQGRCMTEPKVRVNIYNNYYSRKAFVF